MANFPVADKIGLLIDLGNSETRYVLLINGKAELTILSNKFAELQSMYKIPVEYNNKNSTVFMTNAAYFANGLLVEREFAGVSMRPSAIEAKTFQLVTDLSINLVFVKAMIRLVEVYMKPLEELNISFDVSILLPPLEHETNELLLADKIRALKSVKMVIPFDSTVNFSVNSVTVQAEGVAAFFGACYFEKKDEQTGALSLVEVDENKAFQKGYSLVFDIGAGTTDVVLFKDGELVKKSKDTFKLGGNTVESFVRNDIKKKYGFSPNVLTEVISTGQLEESGSFHDVSHIVTNAKDMYSKALMEGVTQYLERMMIDLKEIRGILAIGGGALPSEFNGKMVSPAMSEVLLTYLRKLAPLVKVISTRGKNLRLINIEGLIFIFKYSG